METPPEVAISGAIPGSRLFTRSPLYELFVCQICGAGVGTGEWGSPPGLAKPSQRANVTISVRNRHFAAATNYSWSVK
jgi:hypothetical protein